MNLFNKLTCFKLWLSIMVIVILVFPFYQVGISFPVFLINNSVLLNTKYVLVGIILIFFILINFLNGYLVKKTENDNNYGKMFDLIATKILINGTLIVLSSIGMVSPVVAVMVVCLDIVVSVVVGVIKDINKDSLTLKLDKLKNGCLLLGIIFKLFSNLPFELWSLNIADFLLVLGSIVSIAETIKFYILNKKKIKKS